MIDKDKILSIVRLKGPLIPRDLVKEIGGDTFLTGAILSQMVESKELKISSAKIGGSPVYYVIGQEHKLERLYPFLNEKDKRAYDLLKERKIVRDIECEPLLRVALRNIKDFAKPLEVTLNQNKEIFWKWHLISNTEAEQQIKAYLGPKPEEKRPEPMQEVKQPEEQPKPKDEQQEQKKEQEEPQKSEQVPQKRDIEKQKIKEVQKQEVQERIPQTIHDIFFDRIKKIFDERGVKIIEANVIRKNSDIEMKVVVNSKIGYINFYCRAKDKKKNNDKDLSSLFVEAQLKKMPVLYVTTGELTKKAEQMLSDEFRIITVMRI